MTTNKSTIILLIVLAIAILLGIIVAVYSIAPKSQPSPATIAGTPTPIKTGSSDQQKEYLISPLEKTTIGTTTDSQIKSAFTIASQRQDGDVTIYEVNSQIPGSTDQIRTQNGIVIFESINTQIAKPAPSKIATLEQKYGKAEKIIQSVGQGFYTDAHLYPSKGFMFFANRYTNTVYYVQRFIPMTVTQYETTYGEFLKPAEGVKETFN